MAIVRGAMVGNLYSCIMILRNSGPSSLIVAYSILDESVHGCGRNGLHGWPDALDRTGSGSIDLTRSACVRARGLRRHAHAGRPHAATGLKAYPPGHSV